MDPLTLAGIVTIVLTEALARVVKLLRSKDTEISEESINELSEAGVTSFF